jgi:ABC-type uncharacterized transport system YnjBCD ATPase subunit
MKNVKCSVKGDTLTITVNLKENHGPSASGKTTIIATTAGNLAVPGAETYTLGLNLYTKNAKV